MRKILSVILTIIIISSMIAFEVSATETNLFNVSFDNETKIFDVTVSEGLTGINRVLLIVKDSNGYVVYMDALNSVVPQDVNFSVNLGKSLKTGEYTFILTVDGDIQTSQTKTCGAEVEGEAEFFQTIYNKDSHSFTVTGEILGRNNEPTVNRILLMVYTPEFNTYSDLYYMDALNTHKGTFTFEVPLDDLAPVGTYTFVVSSNGEVVVDGYRTCTITDKFETFGSINKGTVIGGTYTLDEGETAPIVLIALYSKNIDGTQQLVRIEKSTTVIDGKVTAQLQIGADEEVNNYIAKAFVWEGLTTLKPVTSARVLK